MKTKLLAVVASHRKDGNSFTLAKTVLESVDPHPRVLQLATERIESCTVCEKCIDHDCFLDDDLNKVLAEMKRADGVIFVIPKYLTVPSKFLALLERLATIVHIRRHMGYGGEVKNPDYRLFKGKKPFAIFALSGTGKFKKENLRPIVEYIESLGLTLVKHDHPPFLAVNIKAGDQKGEVLKDKAAIYQCKRLAQKVAISAQLFSHR